MAGVAVYLGALIRVSGQQIELGGRHRSGEMPGESAGPPADPHQAAGAPKLGGQTTRLGVAPHDRPACQLPSINQRRHHQQGARLAGSEFARLDESQSAAGNGTIRPSGGAAARPSAQPPAFMALAGNGLESGRAAGPNQPGPGKRFDSSERLRQLRQLLASNSYDAYLVTSSDEHGSEYPADSDRRLQFISGFTGSFGFALVLLDRAVLFTDGRYALQADQQLDCNWWLVVGEEPLTDIPLWLRANAANGLKIATDARLLSLQSFDYLEEQLRRQDCELALITQDLIDVVWNNNALAGEAPAREPLDPEPLAVHPLAFAGNLTWQEKVLRLAEAMARLQGRHYVVSQLDDIAWLLNLRGGDLPMTPLFKAYLLVSRSQAGEPAAVAKPAPGPSVDQLLGPAVGGQPGQPALQSPQVLQVEPSQSIRLTLYVDLRKVGQEVRSHLHADNGSIVVQQWARQQQQPALHQAGGPELAGAVAGGPTPVSTRIQLELKDYEVFIMDLRDKLAPSAKQLQGRLLLNAGANVAIHVLAKGFEERLVLVESLVNKLKAAKSEGEVQGMRQAHWRDSLAIAMLLAQLEQDVGRAGLTGRWSEVSAARELEFYRSLMDFNRGQSFKTISAYGSNAAVVHYSPDHEDPSPRPIGNQSTYLLDSGGQYLDGTTDITRTVHFGEPSEFQRETYTRVLMGSIDLMSLIFEQPARGAYRLNDLLARRHLLELGLDYAHGTGHGIGLYSMVHEAPWLIENYQSGTNAKRQQAAAARQPGAPPVHSEPMGLQPNMFTSVEPGYYRPNDFGIRLENIVVTQRVSPPAGLARPNDRQESGGRAAGERQFLRFEPLSLVPFEPKLIKTELLSNKQKAWLNSYNLMVRLRMTQQVNHYLKKIRAHQPPRLHQRLASAQRGGLAAPAPSANGTDSALGQLNFLRLEGGAFQDKLEQAHRWIMSKTELIPLDVPQLLVAADQQQAAGQQQQQAALASGRKRDQQAQASASLDTKRLMLVYMASLPFNDQEAGEAAAALAEQSPLGARALAPAGRTEEGAGGSKALLAEANKCSGFECDLWLLSSLNRAAAAVATTTSGTTASSNREQRQRPHSSAGSWLSGQDGDADENESLASGASNVLDLFQLIGSNQTSIPVNMWSTLGLGLLVVVQLAIIGFMCRRRGSGASATLCRAPSAAS